MAGRRLVGNSIFMLSNRLAQSIGTFVLTISIARMLGAEALGQYVLAFSYYFIFVNIASQGCKTLFTRELSRNPSEIPEYLVNGFLVQFLFSLVGYSALIALVTVLPYSSDTSVICYIFGLTIIPFALSNITEAIFQAQEKMHLIALSTVPIYILRLLAMIGIMQAGYRVKHLAVAFLLSEIIILIIQLVLLSREFQPKWEIKQDFIWKTIKAVRVFLIIEGVGIISSRIDILILSLLGSEFLVGLYGGIIQLTQPFTIIATSVSLAAFPRLSKAVELGQQKQQQLTENLIEGLLLIALPLLLGFVFLGNDLLKFVYANSDFSQASLALKIAALALIASSFCFPINYALIARGLERINLRETIVTAGLGALLGVVLVSKYQLIGAALMGFCISLIALVQLLYAANNQLFPLRIWVLIRRPLFVNSLMVPAFILLQQSGLQFLTTLFISIIIYTLLLSCLGIHISGGPRIVWAKMIGKL